MSSGSTNLAHTGHFIPATQRNWIVQGLATHLSPSKYDTGKFDVHVTVYRVKFLIIKPTRCTNFSNLFLEWNSTCFRQFLCPSSGVFHCTYTTAVCTMKNSWWWTQELSETCRVSFQEYIREISVSSWFYYKKLYWELNSWDGLYNVYGRNKLWKWYVLNHS
jgi:hypothetical protein